MGKIDRIIRQKKTPTGEDSTISNADLLLLSLGPLSILCTLFIHVGNTSFTWMGWILLLLIVSVL
jgi:hypothetical protein